jgi:hypothetical protein
MAAQSLITLLDQNNFVAEENKYKIVNIDMGIMQIG